MEPLQGAFFFFFFFFFLFFFILFILFIFLLFDSSSSSSAESQWAALGPTAVVFSAGPRACKALVVGLRALEASAVVIHEDEQRGRFCSMRR